MFMCEIRHLFPFSPLSSTAKMVFWITCSSKTNPVVKEYIFAYSDGGALNTSISKKIRKFHRGDFYFTLTLSHFSDPLDLAAYCNDVLEKRVPLIIFCSNKVLFSAIFV